MYKDTNNILTISAKVLSILLHPLFVPTYAFLWLAFAHVISENVMFNVVAVSSTFVFTGLIPLGSILLLKKQKRITSISLDIASERTYPYIYAAVAYSFWVYLVWFVMHIPTYLVAICIEVIVLVVIVALINSKWKISAHLASWGCFTGGVFITAAATGALSNWLIIIMLTIALLLMYSRIYLKSHDGLQVIAGFILGLLITAPALFFL